jgi:hypothetical protein
MSAIWKSAAGRSEVESRYRAILAFWPKPNRQFTVPTRQSDTFVVACGPEGASPLLPLRGSASNSFMRMLDAALEIRWFAEEGRFLRGQAETIDRFLRKALS